MSRLLDQFLRSLDPHSVLKKAPVFAADGSWRGAGLRHSGRISSNLRASGMKRRKAKSAERETHGKPPEDDSAVCPGATAFVVVFF